MPCLLSVIVVVHDMARELPRTLHTLDPSNQRDIAGTDYEVLLIDNGSADPIDTAVLDRFSGSLRTIRIAPAPPSPARAANLGIAEATGDLIGLIVDGARMSSPGLLSTALLAGGLDERPVVTAPAFHLGGGTHMEAAETGHDQTVEDALLEAADWEQDGYALFAISSFAASSGRGLFGPMGESSSLFMNRRLWDELGGLDERFDLPGGGLVNHDLYHRACSAPGSRLIVMLGEGTFHQFHGGAATNRRFGWEEMNAGYEALRGRGYAPPPNQALYVGGVPAPMLPHLERSVQLASARAARSPTGGRPSSTPG